MTFDLSDYLTRIRLNRAETSPEGLKALQSAQMRSITFENIDPLLGTVPDLDPAVVWHKLVEQQRGGYCFELNQLFGTALVAAGFEARRVLARVRNGAPEGGARSHLAWLVETGGRTWLADTGFGGPGTTWPLELDERAPQKTPSGLYRLREDEAAGELVLEKFLNDAWFALFGFDRVPVRDADIEAANVVCAQWAKSPFPSHLMMSRHGEGSRVSLFDVNFTHDDKGNVSRRVLSSWEELQVCLETHFAIPCDRQQAFLIWEKLAETGEAARLAS